MQYIQYIEQFIKRTKYNKLVIYTIYESFLKAELHYHFFIIF